MGFFGVKKRYPYPQGQRGSGVWAIIDFQYWDLDTEEPFSYTFLYKRHAYWCRPFGTVDRTWNGED